MWKEHKVWQLDRPNTNLSSTTCQLDVHKQTEEEERGWGNHTVSSTELHSKLLEVASCVHASHTYHHCYQGCREKDLRKQRQATGFRQTYYLLYPPFRRISNTAGKALMNTTCILYYSTLMSSRTRIREERRIILSDGGFWYLYIFFLPKKYLQWCFLFFLFFLASQNKILANRVNF